MRSRKLDLIPFGGDPRRLPQVNENADPPPFCFPKNRVECDKGWEDSDFGNAHFEANV